MKSEVVVTDKVEISKIEEGIIRVFIKNDVYMVESDLEKHDQIFKSIMDKEMAPFLIIVSKNSSVSKEAEERFANRHRARIKLAEAFVVSSIIHKLNANIFLKIFTPKHPMKIFTKEDKAIAWLKKQIELASHRKKKLEVIDDHSQ